MTIIEVDNPNKFPPMYQLYDIDQRYTAAVAEKAYTVKYGKPPIVAYQYRNLLAIPLDTASTNTS